MNWLTAEDTATAALKFPDGALGAIEASTALWPGWQRRLEICGATGSIALEDDFAVGVLRGGHAGAL